MYRNQYDTDVTTFSPAGRLFQVEYAAEAVKQGSVTLGMVSKTHAVLACLRRQESELASYAKKVYKISHHAGAAVCGLIPDGYSQISFLRDECAKERWKYERNIPIGRLVHALGDKNQGYTQKNEKRPVGTSLLVIGYDQSGPHLFESTPSATVTEYIAHAIGARSQSAITFCERNADTFADLEPKELILQAVRAVKAAHQSKLTSENVSVAIVGLNQSFKELSEDELAEYIETVESESLEEEESIA